MRKSIFTLTLSAACLATAISTAYADDYYSSSQSPNSGYSSSASQSSSSGYSSSASTNTSNSTTYVSTQAPAPAPHKEHKKHDKFSFAINLPVVSETVVVTNHNKHHHRHGIEWVGMRSGWPLPNDAVVGGGQPNPPATLYVCHGAYHGGVHPGKLFNGNCNISWGGNEIVLSRYEVLTSNNPVNWVAGSYGSLPNGAIQGGYENGRPLFICQAEYNGGRHVGKLVGQNCNFGWGGREIGVPVYNVLAG